MTEPIHAMLATHRKRENLLDDVVHSIIDQVDDLFIYLNDYSTDQFIEARKRLPSKCVLLLGSNNEGDMKDNGKFFMSEKLKGFHFTIDDDILYPPDYVERMVDKLEEHDRDVALGVHGRMVRQTPIKSYYQESSTLHFSLALPRDTLVHVIGTGTLAYHRDHLTIGPNMFQSPRMADIWFMSICEAQNMPRLLINRKEGWLKRHPEATGEDSIYVTTRNECQEQTDLINKVL